MTAKVILDKSAINGIERKALKCLGKTAKVLQDDIREAQVIPRMTGTLNNEGFAVDTSTENKGYVRMRFTPPYSRRLYYHPEYNFHTSSWSDGKRTYDGNPHAQGKWLRHWLKGGKWAKRPAEIFEAFLKKEI